MSQGSEIVNEKRAAAGTPVVVVNPTDLTALIAAVNAIGSGPNVVAKSDIISGVTLNLPAGVFHSATLIVRAGTVSALGASHSIGTYTWTAPMLRKLNAISFDGTASTDAQVLTIQ